MVPTWRMRMLPAMTAWPPNFFTPRRWPFESRPYVALCTTPDRAGSVRTQEWSLLWRRMEDDRVSVSLFDRRKDPDELYDLSAARGDVVESLLVHLQSGLDRAGWGE